MSNKLICLVLDVITLVVIGAMFGYLTNRGPKLHYEVDRGRYPVKGIDISAHNGDIDFAAVKADSVEFVIIKATEGTDFCDANFNINYTGATEAGMKVGAYHYFRFDTPGAVQARHLVNTVADREFDLPLVIDVERWGNASHYDIDDVRRQLRVMVDAVSACGYPLMIYTNKRDHAAIIDGYFDDVPYWICSLSAAQPPQRWIYWQHSHAGKVRGINGDVDINTFNGTRADFAAAAARYRVESL